MYWRFRLFVAFCAEHMQSPVGGPDVVVEVDETSLTYDSWSDDNKPKIKYFRLIAALARGSHDIVVEPLPVREQNWIVKPGSYKGCSGSTLIFKKDDQPRPPAPPPISNAEAMPFLKDWIKVGTPSHPVVISTDKAPAYASCIKKKGVLGTGSAHMDVSHIQKESKAWLLRIAR